MEPCVVNCPLLTCISTSLPRSQKSTIWSFLCHKPPQVGLDNQILFIQAIFKAARSFLCHKMSGEQILFYRGIPILRLGGEFVRSARWPMMISRVSHNTPFFELSYALLTSHAIGLEEATKKISAL